MPTDGERDRAAGPDLMIIGAMKCATSTLHVQLARQAGFFMTTPKEPNFFSDDDIYGRGMDWYRGLFAAAPVGALRGESSTHYTKLPTHPRTVDRVVEHGLSPRVIYIMRDPIERLVSQYIHEWTENRARGSIDEAIDEIPGLVDYGRYAMQLEPWVEALGRQRVLLVFFERLRSQPQEQLERVCRFLGYGGAAEWDEGAGRDNVSSERLRKSRVRDAIVNAPGLAQLRRGLVPKAVRNRIKRRWQMTERPRLSEGSVARLRAVYDEDLAKVGLWTGLALTAAGFGEVAAAADPDWKKQDVEAQRHAG